MKPIEYFKVWLLVLIIPLIGLSCSDTKDEPKDDEETEYERELRFANHTNLPYRILKGIFPPTRNLRHLSQEGKMR